MTRASSERQGEQLLEHMINAFAGPGNLVLDPTCGSGMPAYVAEQWGHAPDDKLTIALLCSPEILQNIAFFSDVTPPKCDIKTALVGLP
jgi:hypothetical protein